MNNGNVRVVIDLGSSMIRVLIAELNQSGKGFHVLGYGVSHEQPLNCGRVVDLNATTQAIEHAMNIAERQAMLRIDAAAVAISCADIYCESVFASLRLENGVVMRQDLIDVIKSGYDKSYDPQYETLHILPQQICVDEHNDVADPIGMMADELTIYLLVIKVKKNVVANIKKCIKKTGIDVNAIVFSGVSASLETLNQNEFKIGTLLIDIGAQTIKYMLWQKNIPLYAGVLNVGSDYISSDLSLLLNITREDAEQLKCERGAVIDKYIVNNTIKISNVGLTLQTREIEAQEMVNIINARYSEILETLRPLLIEAKKNGNLINNVVITGGGALINGIEELGSNIFGCNVRVARALNAKDFEQHWQSNNSLINLLGMLKMEENAFVDYIWELPNKQSIMTYFLNLIPSLSKRK